MNTLRRSLLALAVMLAAVPVYAQTSLTSTTLAAAVSASDTTFNVTSNSGIEVGDYIAVVNKNRAVEIATVRSINGTFIGVSRASRLSKNAYATGSTIYHAPKAQFYDSNPLGTCTRSAESFLPHINQQDGIISDCHAAGVWYRLNEQIDVPCYTGALATGSVDQSCWTVNGNYVITKITYVAKVAESAGTLTVIPRRQQGTEAPASGDALATAINAVAAGTAAETVTDFTLTATSALLLLSEDERLGIDFTDDVAGELLGVVVTFTLAPR